MDLLPGNRSFNEASFLLTGVTKDANCDEHVHC